MRVGNDDCCVCAAAAGGAGGEAPTASTPAVDADDDNATVDLIDIWARHHPLQSLEGCPLQAQLHARYAFQQLYTLITPMIKCKGGLVVIVFSCLNSFVVAIYRVPCVWFSSAK